MRIVSSSYYSQLYIELNAVYKIMSNRMRKPFTSTNNQPSSSQKQIAGLSYIKPATLVKYDDMNDAFCHVHGIAMTLLT